MSYRINPISGELSEYAFDFGGVVMLRNFTARVDGERLIIHSSENQNFSILDALVSEVEIDGVVYDNPTKAQEVLQRLVFNANTPVVLPQEERNLISKIGNKIDKIEGKGLSTNDFTDELKTLVESAALTYIQKGGFTGTAQDLKNALDNVLTILNSPDTELDELKEIVPYIKQNKKILSTLGVANIAGLPDALEEKADKVHNHNETYYTKDEVLELTNKTPLMTSLTYFKTTKVFTDVGGGVQYGNTTLLMNPGQNHTIEIVKEGARKIFRYVKLDDGEVNFTSSSDDGIFVIEYTTSDTVLRKGGEAIVVLNGTNAWISINNEKSNQGIGNLQIGGENLILGGRHFVRTATNGEVFSPILYGGLQQGKTYILNAEKIKGADTRMFTISRSQHYESTTHQDIEIGVPFVANHEHTYLWVYPDNNGEIEYKNVILQEGNVGTSFVPERGTDSGLSEEEKQQLLRKDEVGEHIELYSEGKWNKALKINYAKKFAYPEEFTFRPFDLLEKEDKTLSPVFKGIWEEFVKAKAETMTKYYVNPDKGKDSNDGLSEDSPLKSFSAAISKGARYIEITSNSGILSTNTDIKDININGLEPLIIVAPDVINSGGLFPLHFRSGEASKIDETSGVWSLSNVNYVIGMFESDQQGEFNIDRNSLIPYTKHTSLQDLKENGIFPAYFYDSVEKKLYIKQNKYERLSSSSFIHIQYQLNLNIKGQVPFIYVEGINFHNANNEAGLRVHNTDTNQYNTKVYFSKCGFKFNPLGGGLKTINIKEVWTEKCIANNNLTTGFEYFTAKGKEKTKVVEINNLSKLQQTASKIINGNAILRINSNYQNGLTDINILDSGENLKSLNIDVAVSSDYNGELPEFKISGNDAKMWIYYQNWAKFYKISADTDTSTSAKMYSNMADNELGINNLSGEIEQVPMLFDREFKSKELLLVNDVHLRTIGDMIEYSYDNIHWEILFPIKLLAGQIHRKPLKRPIFKKKDGNVFYRFEGSQKWTILCKIEDLIAKEHGVVISPSDVIGDRLNYYKVLFAVNHKVLVLAGKYEFEASNAFGVMPKSGSFIRFSRGAHWKMKPTRNDTYSLLYFGDFISNDVVVEGGYLEGDKWQHGYGREAGQSFDEWGHGIHFSGARNIIVRDVKLSRFSGDGILIGGLYNSRFYNGEIEDCRREGIFVGSCNDVEVHNYKIKDTSSPAEGFKKLDNLEPNLSTSDYRSLSFGINCEPDYADRHIDGFRLYNCVFENNEGYRPIGLSIASHNSATPPWYRNGKAMNLIMKVEAHYCEFHKDTLYSSADTDNSVGYFRIIKPRFYNTKLAAIYFGNHVSANFNTEIDNPKMYDCVTRRITQPTHTEAPLVSPIAFHINDAINGSTGSSVKPNAGHRNISIISPEFYAKDNASLKEQAISFNQNVTKLSDMENVEILNALFVGYKDVIKTFNVDSISPKHSSFKLTYHYDCEFVKKTGDLIVDNTLKNTYIDKSDAGNITFKDNIPVTNLEYYVKNSSQGEVKLKFESATDIEGLAYGVQEFTLARGKRLKMRKIAANRWEYLEGTV